MKVCILGAGAYGLCLGMTILDNKNDVTIWTKFEDEKKSLIETKRSKALPDIIIDNKLNISTDLKNSIKDSQLIIVAVPSNNVREVIELAKDFINPNQHICIASKGIENDSLKFMSDVVIEIIHTENICIISGPGFATDIAKKFPVGLSLASNKQETIDLTKKAFENKYMKLYETNDLIGVQLCGSIKNVLAIASGILAGSNYPISTQSLFLTTIVNNIKDLIIKLGGNKETIISLAGIGDIYLTCSSHKSRNYTFGYMIGSNCSKKQKEEYLKNNNVEGVYTLKSIYSLLKKQEINIPVINKLMDIIYNDASIDDFILSIFHTIQ